MDTVIDDSVSWYSKGQLLGIWQSGPRPEALPDLLVTTEEPLNPVNLSPVTELETTAKSNGPWWLPSRSFTVSKARRALDQPGGWRQPRGTKTARKSACTHVCPQTVATFALLSVRLLTRLKESEPHVLCYEATFRSREHLLLQSLSVRAPRLTFPRSRTYQMPASEIVPKTAGQGAEGVLPKKSNLRVMLEMHGNPPCPLKRRAQARGRWRP